MASFFWAYDNIGPKSGHRYTGQMLVSHWENAAPMLSRQIAKGNHYLCPTKDLVGVHDKFVYAISFRHYVADAHTPDRLNVAIFDWISDDVIAAARRGHCTLLFDDRYEAYPTNGETIEFLRKFAARKNINPSQIIYLTGNKKLAETQTSMGIKIVYFDWFCKFSKDTYLTKHQATLQQLVHPVEKPFRFLSYNRHWNESRQFFVHDLFRENLLKDGLVSLSTPYNDHEAARFKSPSCYSEWALTPDEQLSYAQTASEFLKTLPLVLDQSLRINLAGTFNLDHFLKTDLTVLNETWSHESTLFFTEKLYKTIAAKHPFLVISSPGYLRELRSRGYQTYGQFLDESYDDEPNKAKRMRLILQALKKFVALDPQDRVQARQGMNEIAEHNFNVFLTDTTVGDELYDALLQIAT